MISKLEVEASRLAQDFQKRQVVHEIFALFFNPILEIKHFLLLIKPLIVCIFIYFYLFRYPLRKEKHSWKGMTH